MLSVDGGISLSEDPNIRFDFTPNGADRFTVEAVDTDAHHFRGEFPVETVSQ
jgi:sulfur-oxidizing protein SoxY